MSSKGNVKPVSGGRTILEGLVYAANGSVKRYSGYESLNISPQDIFTGAEFLPKQMAVAITISGLEEITNAGNEQVFDLLEERIKNAEESMTLELSGDLYSDGTADSGKQMGGLQLLVSDTGLGVVGGIDSSVWSFWQNQVISSAAVVSAAPSSTNIQTLMNRGVLQTTRGREQVDLWVADNTMYRYYLESLQAIQRITESTDGKVGFSKLKFWNNSDVVFDGGFNGDAPATHMYGLNTNHIMYRPFKDRNMVPLNPDRYSTNQDAMVRLLGWAGNATIKNRQLQVVVKA